MTRSGIEYDLEISPYTAELLDVKYYFSSQLHKDKFLWEYTEKRVCLRESLTKRFNIIIMSNKLSDILLYRKIETRGFLIEIGGEKAICPEQITFAGEVRIDSF